MQKVRMSASDQRCSNRRLNPSGDVRFGVAVVEYAPYRAEGGQSVSTDLDTGADVWQPERQKANAKSIGPRTPVRRAPTMMFRCFITFMGSCRLLPGLFTSRAR